MNTIDKCYFRPGDAGFKYYKGKHSFEKEWSNCEDGHNMLKLMKDKRSRAAIDAALRYAAGKISSEQLHAYAVDAYTAYVEAEYYDSETKVRYWDDKGVMHINYANASANVAADAADAAASNCDLTNYYTKQAILYANIAAQESAEYAQRMLREVRFWFIRIFRNDFRIRRWNRYYFFRYTRIFLREMSRVIPLYFRASSTANVFSLVRAVLATNPDSIYVIRANNIKSANIKVANICREVLTAAVLEKVINK